MDERRWREGKGREGRERGDGREERRREARSITRRKLKVLVGWHE